MKYALITGCTNGALGFSLAKELSKQKDIHIFATSRKTSSMSDLSSHPNVTLLALDVTSPTSISSALTAVQEKTNGRLDYLVNYAGCGYTMPYLDSDISISQRLFDVNVWGTMRVTQAFAPLVVAAKGTVVMAGSTAEMVGLPWQGVYCASKGALWLMSESLRVEMGVFGVKVLYVTTSFAGSNWFSNVPEFNLPETSLYQPIKHEIEIKATGGGDIPWMKPEIYAEKVVGDILRGTEGRVFRGTRASAYAFAIRWCPGWIFEPLLRREGGLDKFKVEG